MANFEITVATLVENKLAAEHPSLMPYRQSFMLLDFDEEEQRAFGVYRFLIGSVNTLMPLIYRKGELQGTEILIVRDTRMFVPSIDGWVNVMKTAGVRELGELMPEDTRRQGRGPSQVTLTLHQFPFMIKTAEARLTDAECAALLPALIDPTDQSRWELLSTDPFRSFIRRNASAVELVSHTASISPKFRDWVSDRFGDAFLGELESKAGELSARRHLLRKASGIKGRVTILTDLTDPDARMLKPSEKRILLRTGRFVVDHRAEAETSTVWTSPESWGFRTASAPGRYLALMPDGSQEPVQIWLADQQLSDCPVACGTETNQPEPNVAVVFVNRPKAVHVVPQGRLWLHADNNPDGADLEVGMPFNLQAIRDEAARQRAENKYTGDGPHWTTVRLLCGGRCHEFTLAVPKDAADPILTGYNENAKQLVESDGRTVRCLHDRVLVPRKARMVFDCVKGTVFGRPMDLVDRVIREQSAEKLELRRDGDLYYVDGAVRKMAVSETDAHLALVLQGGIKAATAANMLREVRPERASRYLVRRANTEDEEAKALSNLKISRPTETRTSLNQASELGGKSEQLASAAPKEAEKDDTRMLKALTELTDFREITADQIRSFSSAMDEAGQFLLRILARRDEYDQRYGEEDTDTLEDSVRTQFANVGGLVLFLREKRGDEGLADNEQGLVDPMGGDMA